MINDVGSECMTVRGLKQKWMFETTTHNKMDPMKP